VIKAIHYLGDLYHMLVYRSLAEITSVTDLTKYAIMDVGLGAALFINEIVLLTVALSILAPPKESSTFGLVATLAFFMLAYGLNFFRSPVTSKMGLTVSDLVDPREEMLYAIGRLKELESSAPVGPEELNHRINESLDSFLFSVNGYYTPHATRTKRSLFSKWLFRRKVIGLACPLFQEVVMTTDLFPEAIAHEKAHAAGYIRESEAQFIGYAALHSDPKLRRLAYVQRLDMLMSAFDVSVEDCLTMGLDERTASELNLRNSKLDEEVRKNSAYRKVMNFFGRSTRSIMLFLFGQGNLDTAYLNSPLLIISAYDPPTR